AYLTDVFVVAEERNSGLGQWLIDTVLDHSPLQNLRRWMLVTKNAKNLYLRCGFTELCQDSSYLERYDAAVYTRGGLSDGHYDHDAAPDGHWRRSARRTAEHARKAWAGEAADHY